MNETVRRAEIVREYRLASAKAQYQLARLDGETTLANHWAALIRTLQPEPEPDRSICRMKWRIIDDPPEVW